MPNKNRPDNFNNAQATDKSTAQLTNTPQQGLNQALANGTLSSADYEKLLAELKKKQ